jgi:hypothetical protein
MQVSAEVRWFWREDEPIVLAQWFRSKDAHGRTCGGGGIRIDKYLVDGRQTELGIKSRGGKGGTEIKGLVAITGTELEAAPFVGSIEIWTKWTTNSIDLASYKTVTIEKQRWLRKFDTTSEQPVELHLDESENLVGDGSLPPFGCNVEFTSLRLPSRAQWWTLGFESFGTIENVERDLLTVAGLLVGRGAPLMENCLTLSYPRWLVECILEHPD